MVHVTSPRSLGSLAPCRLHACKLCPALRQLILKPLQDRRTEAVEGPDETLGGLGPLATLVVIVIIIFWSCPRCGLASSQAGRDSFPGPAIGVFRRCRAW